jgi:short-subunit dehydrogenase
MKYALISGGSKGIGFAIASALARRNFNLLLVARNTEDLRDAQKKLKSSYTIEVEILSLDMYEKDAAEKIAADKADADFFVRGDRGFHRIRGSHNGSSCAGHE